MDIIIVVILLCVALLILDYYMAREFENIAEMNGHYGRKYFWWTFWIPVYGIAMVIALPDKTNKATKTADELPEI